MLPARHRLRASEDFRSAVRRGKRGAAGGIVAHVVCDGAGPARIGFVVGRGIGNAVERNRLKRRLRAIAVRDLVAEGDGDTIVVRALPAAREAEFEELAASVRTAVKVARRRATGT